MVGGFRHELPVEDVGAGEEEPLEGEERGALAVGGDCGLHLAELAVEAGEETLAREVVGGVREC